MKSVGACAVEGLKVAARLPCCRVCKCYRDLVCDLISPVSALNSNPLTLLCPFSSGPYTQRRRYPRSKEASSCLKKHNWRLDAAIDAYYSGSGAAASPAKSATDPATMERRIVDLFNKYKGICPNRFGYPVTDNCTFDPQSET